MEPTQEWIKEFWEACGLHHYVSPKEKISYEDNHWIAPDGTKYSGYPPIDLNNLFEYAVPKAIKSLQEKSGVITPPMRISETTAFRELITMWLAENPIQFGFEATLFRALDKVKEVSE